MAKRSTDRLGGYEILQSRWGRVPEAAVPGVDICNNNIDVTEGGTQQVDKHGEGNAGVSCGLAWIRPGACLTIRLPA